MRKTVSDSEALEEVGFMLAGVITVSRMLFSLALLAVPARSIVFAAFYLLCGLTDVLDGFAARKLHTESEKGAMLDSAADLIFAAVYAVRIIPLLSVPHWILIWTAVIAAVKLTVIAISSKKARGLSIGHSIGNRLTGVLLFLLPVSAFFIDAGYGAALACLAASLTVIKEIGCLIRESMRRY